MAYLSSHRGQVAEAHAVAAAGEPPGLPGQELVQLGLVAGDLVCRGSGDLPRDDQPGEALVERLHPVLRSGLDGLRDVRDLVLADEVSHRWVATSTSMAGTRPRPSAVRTK